MIDIKEQKRKSLNGNETSLKLDHLNYLNYFLAEFKIYIQKDLRKNQSI